MGESAPAIFPVQQDMTCCLISEKVNCRYKIFCTVHYSQTRNQKIDVLNLLKHQLGVIGGIIYFKNKSKYKCFKVFVRTSEYLPNMLSHFLFYSF